MRGQKSTHRQCRIRLTTPKYVGGGQTSDHPLKSKQVGSGQSTRKNKLLDESSHPQGWGWLTIPKHAFGDSSATSKEWLNYLKIIYVVVVGKPLIYFGHHRPLLRVVILPLKPWFGMANHSKNNWDWGLNWLFLMLLIFQLPFPRDLDKPMVPFKPKFVLLQGPSEGSNF